MERSYNSSHVTWVKVAQIIEKYYHNFDKFIVIGGTDTMAYLASALSFMLENLGKTVIVTGSQIPLTELRSDAESNLLGAMTACEHDIYEVCLFFNNKLLRGNRSTKNSSVLLDSFQSPNLSPLANFDVYLKFH